MSTSSQAGSADGWELAESVGIILSPAAYEVARYWVTAADFLDENGHPAMLAMRAQSEPGFYQLVEAVHLAVPSCDVLDELLRKGVAEQLESHHVLLRRSAYVHNAPGFDASSGVRRRKRRPGESAGRRKSDNA